MFCQSSSHSLFLHNYSALHTFCKQHLLCHQRFIAPGAWIDFTLEYFIALIFWRSTCSPMLLYASFHFKNLFLKFFMLSLIETKSLAYNLRSSSLMHIPQLHLPQSQKSTATTQILNLHHLLTKIFWMTLTPLKLSSLRRN